MGYFRLDSNKLDQRSLMVALSGGFEITKQVVRAWMKSKFKVEIHVQPFSGGYIGTVFIEGKSHALGNDTKSYIQFKTEDDCFYALLVRAFEMINKIEP